MCAYHSCKCVFLVLFLQEDESVCEKERQHVYGCEEKEEKRVKMMC